MKKQFILLPLLLLTACTTPKEKQPEQAPIAAVEEQSNNNKTNTASTAEETSATANGQKGKSPLADESIFQGNLSQEQSQKVVSKTREILSAQGVSPIDEENVLSWITKEEGPKIISIAKTSDSVTKVIYDKDSGEVYLIERDNQLLYRK